MKPVVRHWPDIMFAAHADDVQSHFVSFTIYELDGPDSEVLHDCDGKIVASREPYAHGDVKWDGCSNWDIDELQTVMLHGCNRRDLLTLGEAMGRCWDWSRELMDSAEGEPGDAPAWGDPAEAQA